MQYFTTFFNVSRETRDGAGLLAMKLPSDFANDHHNRGLSFSNSNAKNFLTKTIFVYLMVGNIIPFWL
jgi:hypothetical protein